MRDTLVYLQFIYKVTFHCKMEILLIFDNSNYGCHSFYNTAKHDCSFCFKIITFGRKITKRNE